MLLKKNQFEFNNKTEPMQLLGFLTLHALTLEKNTAGWPSLSAGRTRH